MVDQVDYSLLAEQLTAVITDETDIIANMANFSALLFDTLPKVNWVGFYRVVDEQLILGPFQGKLACVRIPFGRGVCGTAAAEMKTLRIANVHDFDGHIACDAASESEIVIPVVKNCRVIAVLDIDAPITERFSEADQQGLEQLVTIFEQHIQ